MGLTQIVIPFVDSLDLGVGVDSMTSSPMGKVVVGEASGVTGADGAKVGFDIGRVRTTHDLETKLNIDVKAGYAGGPFANASARFDFAKASKIQSSTLCMTISSRVTLAARSIDDPALSPNAAALADNPQAFAQRFGDMFVRGIGRGGLFMATLKIDTSDEQTSEEISANLSGSYGLFSGEAQTKLHDLAKNHRSDISIGVYHEGGPIDLNPSSIEDPLQLLTMLQLWLKSFADNPEKMAVPYFATLAPIAIANGPLPLNAADAEHAQDVLASCAKQRSAIIDGMNLMDAISQTPRRYSFAAPVTVANIRAASSGYQADLDLVAAAASSAMNHPASAKMPAAFALKRGQTYPQGIPPTPMPELDKGLQATWAARGQRVALRTPLLAAMRALEPEGACKTGFDIGVGIAAEQTAWGPGKQGAIDNLPVTEKDSAENAARFAVCRNAQADLAIKGAAIATADTRATIVAARAAEPPGYFTLGFDIATTMFSSQALGGFGRTGIGPGAADIRSSLPPAGIRGFDSSVSLYMGK